MQRPLTTLKKIGSHIYDKQSAAKGFMILTVRPCIDIYVGTRWAIIPLEFICLKILFNQSYFLTVIRSGVVQFFTLVHRKMGAMGWSDFLRFGLSNPCVFIPPMHKEGINPLITYRSGCLLLTCNHSVLDEIPLCYQSAFLVISGMVFG